MAAFANRNDGPSSNTSRPNLDDTSPKRRTLPEGGCSYRDISAGLKPPGCGCRRFWLRGEVYAVQERTDGQRSRDPWCICGHHACFHDLVERMTTVGMTEDYVDTSTAPPRGVTRAIEQELGNIGGKGIIQSTGSSLRREMRALGDIQQADSRLSTPGRMSARHMQGLGLDFTASNQAQRLETHDLHHPDPRIRSEAITRQYGGLGLLLHGGNQHQDPRHASPSPTIPDGASDRLFHDSQFHIPSTRDASENESLRNISPDTGFMQRVLAAQRFGPPLDVTNALAATEGMEDFIQSATEVATPSVANTPDFGRLTQIVQDTMGMIGTVNGSPTCAFNNAGPSNLPSTTNNTSSKVVVQAVTQSSGISSETVQAALRNMPLAIQQLTPLVTSLHEYLSRNPDISIHESIQGLARRMENLENSSFSHVPPEQIHEQFQMVDGRLIDLENQLEEHGRLIANFDPDASTHDGEVRRIRPSDAHASFESNQSLASATSSALISAALDRVETDRRFRDVEGRLDDLEKVQLPSLIHPWEVEVVLLPWGRDLRGLWYPPTELLKPGNSQDSEPWTQARSMRSMSRAAISLGATTGESGWSDQAIHQWAGNAEKWLSPKACGSNGVVYHRLCSRGLAMKVILTSPGARDIRNAVCKAFGPLLGVVSGKGQDQDMEDDANEEDDDLYLGLEAPFVPLRKVHKSSRLRFLAPTELITPDLWTAEFLISGVIMRASGGQKRLFVTTKEAYLQPSGELSSSWTWQKLRELPRVEAEEQIDKGGSHVPEADALEPCWVYHPSLDPHPSSIHSSFASHVSASSIHEQQVPVQTLPDLLSSHHEDSEDELSIHAQIQPITPMSEFPTQRSLHRRTRTMSIPLTETSSAPPNPEKSQISRLQRSFPSQLSKRRIQSFSHSSNPLIATLPTFIPSPSKSRSRIMKRRRLTRSRSGSPSEAESKHSLHHSAASLDPDIDPNVVLSHLRERVPSGESIMPIWAFTPRRSKEPHSPFFAEDGDSGADAIAGASQSTTNLPITTGGRVENRKRGITPSAYATPFSGTVQPPVSGDESDAWGGVEDGAKAVDTGSGHER
ncbi:hypothetical protein EJ08DRAFT_480703 [Tothia fuscella]|uniref:Uncharacterized protein n=1 Tax=Tothia fuscella TaxID=1048955 RepID=A0A9P4TUE4_9PEZI|nr:hypothetical protein EJ08DRAFT_480703 [Tothia fuscella]